MVGRIPSGALRRTGLLALFALAASPAMAASKGPEVMTTVAGFPITNSMITTWVTCLFIILVIRLLAPKPTLIPSRGQSVLESVVIGLRSFYESLVGPRMIGPVFPILAGLFIFILLNNWSGLLPGLGSVGQGYTDPETGRFIVEKAILRPANTDLNTTLGMAIFGMIAWLYFVLRYAGIGILLHDLFGNKADKKETPAAIYYLLWLIFPLVGLIEVASIMFRPISLSFRLYGNMFGGENLLMSMTNVSAWILPIPFYLYETLVSLIQAFIFTLLLAIYISLITSHADHEHDDDHAADDGHATPVKAAAH